jgi:hypothetical protein
MERPGFSAAYLEYVSPIHLARFASDVKFPCVAMMRCLVMGVVIMNRQSRVEEPPIINSSKSKMLDDAGRFCLIS